MVQYRLRMLIDEVKVTFIGGRGGNGAVSFRQSEGKPRGGPDGGNGGDGGNVYLVGINDMMALSRFQFKKVEKGEDGVEGKRKNLFGRNGEHLIVPIPIGTTVTNTKTKKSFEIVDTTTKHQVARGGRGGKGNNEFKSSTNQAPRYAESGKEGESVELHLVLRLIADIGLIGLPNAGKSSLLSSLTNANPKIGDYPFTTLEPNLGVLKNQERTIILADIPGLIEGASKGKGLGIRFLRHIEKTRLLVHCLDATADSVVKNYQTIRDELSEYGHDLTNKKEILLLTKTDLIDSQDLLRKKKELAKISDQIFSLSIYDQESQEELKKFLFDFVN